MNRISELLGLAEKEVVVWTYDGIIQGRAYRKESEVAEYIDTIFKNSSGRLQVVIQKA